ncbi:MAG TPA: hypothetical protein ENK44_14610 [Caldithrix abyssi]|uniref:Uncharacterized protein n=1 Tax=Caldithrix abyssi TaxID=187145 RepID=A0A7V4U3X3_CALAY|nr:hypothetical protein [Caldithrix abyssi]
MKLFLITIGLLNGSYMLIDGVYVLVKGKYIGPEKPGPWAGIFAGLGIDVFKLGPLFVLFGLLWLIFVYGVQTSQNWVYVFGLIVSAATLWYLPFGTFISIISIVLLLFFRQNLGIQ